MIRQLIIKILFRKDVQTMAIIYATLIIKGKKTFADVPDRIKDKVKEVLVDLDCPELAEYPAIALIQRFQTGIYIWLRAMMKRYEIVLTI